MADVIHPELDVAVPLAATRQLNAGENIVHLLFAILAPDGSSRDDQSEDASTPQVWLESVTPEGPELAGECHRYSASDAAELDRYASSDTSPYIATFQLNALAQAGLDLRSARLRVSARGLSFFRLVSPREEDERPSNIDAPQIEHDPPPPRFLRRLRFGRALLVAAGCAFLPLGLGSIIEPAWVLGMLGWSPPSHPDFEVLITRLVGLTLLLLFVNLWLVRRTIDRNALSGYGSAAALFWFALAVSNWRAKQSLAVTCICGALSVVLLLVARLIAPGKHELSTPHRAYWEFWSPLFWVGLLTLVVGLALLCVPGFWVHHLKIDDPDAHGWLQLLSVAFFVNTVAMWSAQYTRDLRVVAVQRPLGRQLADGHERR